MYLFKSTEMRNDFLPDGKLYVIHLNIFGSQFYTLNMSHTYPHTVRQKASWLQSNHLGSRRNSWLSCICFAFKWLRSTWPMDLDTCGLLQSKKVQNSQTISKLRPKCRRRDDYKCLTQGRIFQQSELSMVNVRYKELPDLKKKYVSNGCFWCWWNNALWGTIQPHSEG